MSKIIGIDLGTTNSCVAVMESGEPRVLTNSEGGRTTPSIVAVADRGERLVGQAAKRQAVTNPEDTVFGIKRLIGRKYDSPEVQQDVKNLPYQIERAENGDVRIRLKDRVHSPAEISSFILAAIKKSTEDALGETVTDAVITVPAYFNDRQRQATKDVTPLSLGIETMGGVMTRLIDKNTTIPTRKSEMFTTAEDNQSSVTVHVLQGEREMASGNKSLGRFELAGIPPAPRGMPQIEVTFDIDANDIVEVSAKDKATGKEQSIQIMHSSGLTREEIDRLVNDAKVNASEDRRRRELVDARNHADGLIYSVEKTLADLGGRVEGAVCAPVESTLSELKKSMEADNTEEIKRKTEALKQASHRIAEQVYQQPAGGSDHRKPQDASGNAGKETGSSRARDPEDDVIEAEYEES
jgi:molecular chaperone DnaK (HSP70)